MSYLNGVDDVYVNGENGRQRIQYRIALDANGNAPQFVDIGGVRYAVRRTVRKKQGLFGKIVGVVGKVAGGAIKIGGSIVKPVASIASTVGVPGAGAVNKAVGFLGESTREQYEADRRHGFSNRALLVRYRGRV